MDELEPRMMPMEETAYRIVAPKVQEAHDVLERLGVPVRDYYT